jgi:hypothetical protein
LIQGSYGTNGNFELVTPSPNADGLVHYNRDNDSGTFHWGGPSCFGEGRVSGVSLIQSNFGRRGQNLEVVANIEGRLEIFWRDDQSFIWRGPIVIATGVCGVPALIQGTLGERGNFEVVTPMADGGLAHFWRDNDHPRLPWFGPDRFGEGSFEGAALIQSNFGPGNLEVVAQQNGELHFYWRDPANATWHGPQSIAEGIGGTPAIIQSTYGNRGNFEVVAPLNGGGLGHFWRNNDDAALPWRAGRRLDTGESYSHAGLLQSTVGGEGNLEIVARRADRLVHHWRDAATHEWSGPALVGIEHRRAVAECVYYWSAAYFQHWTDVTIRIALVPDPGVGEEELAMLRVEWRRGIRDAWNGRCACRTARGAARNLTFNVEWVDADAHHEVRVCRGPVRSTMLAWGTTASGAVAAHEFGHMLGLPDEYESPPCPNRQRTATGSIMDRVDGPVMETHVQALCAWLCNQAAASARQPGASPAHAR